MINDDDFPDLGFAEDPEEKGKEARLILKISDEYGTTLTLTKNTLVKSVPSSLYFEQIDRSAHSTYKGDDLFGREIFKYLLEIWEGSQAEDVLTPEMLSEWDVEYERKQNEDDF